MDCDRRINYGETLALSANPREDPAWLHQSENQKEEEIGVQLFSGHYTSLGRDPWESRGHAQRIPHRRAVTPNLALEGVSENRPG